MGRFVIAVVGILLVCDVGNVVGILAGLEDGTLEGVNEGLAADGRIVGYSLEGAGERVGFCLEGGCVGERVGFCLGVGGVAVGLLLGDIDSCRPLDKLRNTCLNAVKFT